MRGECLLLKQDSEVHVASWLRLRLSRGLRTRIAQMEEICLLQGPWRKKRVEVGRVGWFVINSVREFR